MTTKDKTSGKPVAPTTTLPSAPVQTGGVESKAKNSVSPPLSCYVQSSLANTNTSVAQVEMVMVLLAAAAGFFVFA